MASRSLPNRAPVKNVVRQRVVAPKPLVQPAKVEIAVAKFNEKCGNDSHDDSHDYRHDDYESDSSSENDYDNDHITLNHGVVIPGADRFVPYALTIRVGDTVTWRNNDGNEEHSVTSIDAVNSAKNPANVDHVLVGAGNPFTLTFNEPGQWLYYCRFHAALDEFSQPYRLEESSANNTAKGGKKNPVNPPVQQQPQEEEVLAPMMGVITILPRKKVLNHTLKR